MPRAAPYKSNQLPSHLVDKSRHWPKALKEDNTLILMIERLILNDLEEQERLHSSATKWNARTVVLPIQKLSKSKYEVGDLPQPWMTFGSSSSIFCSVRASGKIKIQHS
jgi:hypothetical protein